jgi:hypothetical protein
VLHERRDCNAIMNGVSRFLSRREKQPGKRSSKNNHSKVRTPSPSPSLQLQMPAVDGSESQASGQYLRRRADSLHTLYHKLPSILPYYGGDNAFFVRQKTHDPHISPFQAEASPIQSSNNMPLQSRSFPPDYYTIFSKSPPKSSDKEDEKKV